MALTRKDKEHLAELQAKIESLETHLALRWSEPVDEDIQPSDGEQSGWFVREYSQQVEVAWTTRHAHGIGYVSRSAAGRSSASQLGVSLHSTKIRALRALRYSVAAQAASDLRKIDLQILVEENK